MGYLAYFLLASPFRRGLKFLGKSRKILLTLLLISSIIIPLGPWPNTTAGSVTPVLTERDFFPRFTQEELRQLCFTQVAYTQGKTQQEGGETMTRDEVLALCKKVAPEYGYDPLMLLAQIEQESSYDEAAARLEQGFFSKYVRPHPVLGKTTPAVKVMMSSSYGLGQLMGLSLYELQHFFSTDSVTVAMALDVYIGQPEMQIRSMCEWLKKKQAMGDSHTLDDALRRYNGSADYPPLVYARYKRLKGIYG